MTDGTSILPAAISCMGSIIVGLVAWGRRGEIATLRAEMKTLQAEMRASIAEAVNDFYVRVNGNYVKKDVCKTVHAATDERLVKVEQSVEGME
jgi:hypothetical protein